jgi:formylglycine-generating enzyme required for sulfatase activity
VNNDGEVNIADVNVVIDMILTGATQLTGDVNGDGEINIADVNAIIDIILNGSTPAPSGIETITVNGVSFNMVMVEGGTFTMGATPEQVEAMAHYNEYPDHQVTLSSYCIGETEVTQALWQAVMGSNPSSFIGDLNNPVEMVSWDDCQGFVDKLNQMTGKTFRLPTEAEWEFAARGGNKRHGYIYAGSDNIDEVAWYWSNSDDKTHPVATKKANELGLYDMSGNVYEWCQDFFGYYSSEDQINPTGPVSGYSRIFRGGSWYSDTRDCRVSYRYYNIPDGCWYSVGLRLAM